MRSLKRRSRISEMEILILALVLTLISLNICVYSYIKIYKVAKDIKKVNVDFQLLEKQLKEADLKGSPHQQGSEVNEQS